MVIGIIGESCTGKSTLAERIAAYYGCEIMAGKDYLRLAKSEPEAKERFQLKLNEALTGEHIIYVIAEKEHLELLPDGAARILVTAELEQIKARFAQRMRGTLPPTVAAMLERKHGCFDQIRYDIHMISGVTDVDSVIESLRMIGIFSK